MAIAIIRDDLLGKSAKGIPAEKIPTMMNYTTLLDKDSMYNTPAVLVHLHDRSGDGLPAE